MHEKIKEFLETQNKTERERYEKEKQKTLMELGLYEREYDPLIGFCHTENDNKTLKIHLKNDDIKVGDKISVKSNGELVQVIVDKIQSNNNYIDFPFYEPGKNGSIGRNYRKKPIEVTDEEYEKIKKNSKTKAISSDNLIANILIIIAWIIFIVGIIAGISLWISTEEITLALPYWCISFISGTMFLGFAEIIKLLEAIKNK